MTDRPDLRFEQALREQGWQQIAGLDEAGRGALAGPVAVGAVILPDDRNLLTVLEGVRDSKQMTAPQREYWAERIRAVARTWAVGFASPEEIDALGITPAIRLAAHRALDALFISPDALLCDYLLVPQRNLPMQAIKKGDQRSLSIAAASVLAKVARDAVMVALAARYPGYDLENNKGYGTAAHRLALTRLGPSPIHRRRFRLLPEAPSPEKQKTGA